MEDDDGAGLSVGFAIDTNGAFAEVLRFAQMFDQQTLDIIRQVAKVEQATGGMVKLGPATAEMVKFGTASTRELQNASREMAKVERAGEAMAAQLQRANATYGKTRDELRGVKAETAALAAEQQGLTELAGRIRGQEAALAAATQATAAARDAEAQATREAAHAYTMFEAAARAGMQVYRDQQALDAAAQKEREAQAVRSASQAYVMFEARVREGVAAMKAEQDVLRQNALAEREQQLRSASLAYAMFETRVREGAQAMREAEAAAERDAATLASLRAMIDPAAASQNRLNAELAEARRVMTAAGASAQELAAAEDALWARSQRATAQHGLMAGAARKNGFALQTVALQLPDITQGLLTGQKPMTVFIQQGFQIVQVAQMAEGGLRGFGKELGALALRFAPLLAGLAVAAAGLALFTRWVNEGVTNDQLTKDLGKITGGADATKQELFKLKDATITFGDTASALFSVVGKDVAEVFVGDMKSMSKDVKSLLDDLTSYGRTALAGMYAGVAGLKAYMGEISSREGLARLLTGDPTLNDRTFGEAFRRADKYLGDLGARVKKQAIVNARERNAKTIGLNEAPKPKVDGHAAQLAREAQAMEAQIRNLYALADAYGVSGAAALIAEARVKAETDAIKKRGDVEAFVDRQVRLAIAERVKAAAQGAAAMRDQAAVQVEVNAMIADGLVPLERADELTQTRMKELPLLQAIEAAQQRGLLKEAERATKALEDQRDAQRRADAAEIGKRFIAADIAAERRLAELRTEAQLIAATDMERVKALATIRATNEALAMGGVAGTPFFNDYVAKQVQVATATEANAQATRNYAESLTWAADRWDLIARNVSTAGQGMADAFGSAGRALGDLATIYAGFNADRARLDQQHLADLKRAGTDQAAIDRANTRYALQSTTAQIGAFGDMTAAAKGFFNEKSKGYKALQVAEKAFRAVEFALSVRAMAQDAIETGSKIATTVARTAASATEAVVNAIKSLPFPLNLAAGAATAGAIAALGVSIIGSFGGGGNKLPASNTGTGTVLGDKSAQSESLKRAIDGLKDIDTLMLSSSREMAGLLRSIDSQIGGVAALVVRAGDVNASGGVAEGFQKNAIGSILSKVPVIGGILGGLFGSKTTVVGSGISAGPQSLGSVLNGGFDASYYSDVQKKKKLFGITTGTKYSTQYTGADAGLENQFTMILRDFNSAIVAAAGPLGESTEAIQRRLNGFVVNLGKIDLQGLTGEQIQEKLTAVFGAAADKMAAGAFPGFDRFQKVGEGLFETIIRVSSTVEAVTASLDMLGGAARALGIDAKVGLASQFDSISDFNSAATAYFEAFYSSEEQAAAKTAQLAKVFGSLGVAMPDTIAGFRALVDSQNLTTAAGQATYATLLQLAPAFANLKQEMDETRDTADILAERRDLERKILELRGDTSALRALDLDKLDVSNRALQEQVWAIEDAQKAADAAEQLRDAWASVGDTIADEVRRIRGLTAAGGSTSFATLQGQFNAATSSARSGDIDAAKSLPGLSQSLLAAAEQNATSRQELDRVRSVIAASLEATNASIASQKAGTPALSAAGAITAVQATQGGRSPVAANDDAATQLRLLREEVANMRTESRDGHAKTATEAGRSGKALDRAIGATGGVAIGVRTI